MLSVLIPCRNEVRFLARCLDSVLASDYPQERMEVLVIDGASSDGTGELIARYAASDRRVRRIENPDLVTPCALNRGIAAASGDVIARLDAHSSLAPDYLTLCVAHLLSSGADNVGGAMRTVAQDDGLWAPVIVAALSHRFGVGNSHFRTGSTRPRFVDTVFGGCWRREVFARVGGFNPALRRSQDMEFSLRLKAAGGRTLLVPDARCDYYARTRLAAFCRHNFINGEWAILPFVYSDVVPVRARHLIPGLFALLLIATVVMLPWSPWPLAAVGGSYLMANLAVSASIAWRGRRPLAAVLLPVVFGALHLGYGLGSLWGVILAAGEVRGRQMNDLVRSSEEIPCIRRQY